MTLAVIAAGMLAMGLSGCGQAAQGAPAPAHTTTTATQEHHVAPRTPQTRDGAVEFLYAYVAERDRAYLSNDESAVITYSSRKCQCTRLIEDKLRQRRADGYIAVSPGNESSHITRIGRWEQYGRMYKIGLETEVPAADVVNNLGGTVLHNEAVIQRELFTLDYDRDHWVIEDSIGYRKPKPR